MVAVAVPPVAATPWRSRRRVSSAVGAPLPPSCDPFGHQAANGAEGGQPTTTWPGATASGAGGSPGRGQGPLRNSPGRRCLTVRPSRFHTTEVSCVCRLARVEEPGGGQRGRDPAAVRRRGPPQVAGRRAKSDPPLPDQPDREGVAGSGEGARPSRVGGDPLPGRRSLRSARNSSRRTRRRPPPGAMCSRRPPTTAAGEPPRTWACFLAVRLVAGLWPGLGTARWPALGDPELGPAPLARHAGGVPGHRDHEDEGIRRSELGVPYSPKYLVARPSSRPPTWPSWSTPEASWAWSSPRCRCMAGRRC